ncbi:uncharacterized protein LOC128201765 isoform X2 [Galleria mellonella]|uniref:Uncharacterized protein LOC128201765 isoform X2 n=1 Tax=Galleria mellonella TaxID=7137 RepID=A0ABM3MWM1_GALME|nr:uncharacterized protein LOC128201765 isoform X2 [Galleria mellonella]
MSVGKLSEFDVQEGNWKLYIDRMDMYFKANTVKDELKVPTLISVVGDAAYELMVNLCSPSKPCEKTYSELVYTVQKFLQPKPSVLAERYRFRQCRQSNGQSVAQYVAQLKKMAANCEFNLNFNENMRDQFICGILSDGIRQRLFAEEKIDFERALSLSLSLEAAERDAQVVENKEEGVSYSHVARQGNITTRNKLHESSCWGCGDIHHTYKQCKFRDYVCSRCNQKGHLRRVCPVKEQGLYGDDAAWTAGPRYRVQRGANIQRGRGVQRNQEIRSRGRGYGTGNNAKRLDSKETSQARAYWVREGFDAGHQMEHLEEADGNASDSDEAVYQMSLGQYKPIF